MTAARPAGTSYTAAAVLAAITIFVFYTLRDYGPRSAVRRFHDDIQTKDLADLQKVSVQPVSDVAVQSLGQEIQALDKQSGGAPPQMVDEKRSPSEVSVLTLYHVSPQSRPVVWIVEKDRAVWRVNAQATIEATLALWQPNRP